MLVYSKAGNEPPKCVCRCDPKNARMLLFIGNELFWWKPWSAGVVWNQEKAELGRAVLYRPYSPPLPLLWLVSHLWVTDEDLFPLSYWKWHGPESSSFLSTCEFALLGASQTILYKCVTNFGLPFVMLLSIETIKQFLRHKRRRRTDLLFFWSPFQCVPN